MSIPGYDTDPVPDLVFTQAEIDMLYYASLLGMGHEQAQQFDLTSEGIDSLHGALTKIQAWNDSLALTGEPQIVSPE